MSWWRRCIATSPTPASTLRGWRAAVARETKARIPTDEELRRIATRAVAEIIPQREFVDGLRSGRRLRLKMGFDPTKPGITLGWAGGLRKLRQLPDLGHP